MLITLKGSIIELLFRLNHRYPELLVAEKEFTRRDMKTYRFPQ